MLLFNRISCKTSSSWSREFILDTGFIQELPIPLREAAQASGVGYDRLRRAAYDGRLKAQKRGNQYLVLQSDVNRFLVGGDGRRRSGDEPAAAAGAAKQLNRGQDSRGSGTGKGESMLARVIAIAAPKGGTAKTTTTLNLGAALSEQGFKVLLVDLDPQGNLTLSAGVDASQLKSSLDSVIKHYLATYTPQLEATIIHAPVGIDLVPSNIRLAATADEMLINSQGVSILQKLLRSVRTEYDFILIDTLPSLGVLVKNALVAAQEVIIPHELEPLSTEAVAMMLRQVDITRRSELNTDLKVAGILITKATNSRLHQEVIEYTRSEFGRQVPVFKTVIERSIQFAEAQGLHKTILAYKPKGKGALAYRNLARELIYGPQAVIETVNVTSEEIEEVAG